MSTATTTNGAPLSTELSSWQQSWLNKQQPKEVCTTKHTDGLSHCHSHCPAAVCTTTPTLLLLCCLWGHLPASHLVQGSFLRMGCSSSSSTQKDCHWTLLLFGREREFVSSSFAWLCLQISSCCCPLTKWPSWSTQAHWFNGTVVFVSHSLTPFHLLFLPVSCPVCSALAVIVVVSAQQLQRFKLG